MRVKSGTIYAEYDETGPNPYTRQKEDNHA